ncbi:MAG: porin [Caldilineae bacterium]|nr:MAG: porin [Caldilineae bacterium]
MKSKTLAIGVVMGLGLSGAAEANDAETLRQLKAQVAAMQAQIEALEQRLKEQEQNVGKVAQTGKKAGKQPKAVQVYGQIRVSADHKSGDWSGGEGTEIASNASRLGVKGQLATALEGTSLFYQAEVRYETTDFVNGGPGTTTGTKQLEFREGYGGLKGSWGKFRMGRLNVGYKKTGTKIDPWTDNVPQARAGGRQGMSEFHSSYFNNAVEYETPRLLDGLKANFWASSRFNGSSKPLHNTGTLKNYVGGQAYGLGAKYAKGPIFVGADWLKIDAETINKTGLANDSGWQIGGRYTFGAFSVAAFYEDVKDLGLGRNTYVNAIYKTGRLRIIGAYGQNRDGTVYGNKDWNDWSLGVKYNLTKKSELLAAWNSRRDDTANKDFNTLTVGFNAKFGY